MKPGIKDVAKVAGVSPTTVSRVLNNRGYISEETRKKVYDAMEEINYYPNEIARALLNNRTYFVGVIVPRCFCVTAKIRWIQRKPILIC